MNTKSDVFASENGNTGNWAMRYKVGWAYNVALDGSNNAVTYNPGSWLGELPSSGEKHSIPPLWADDRSNNGSDTGGGDYTPTTLSTLPVIQTALMGYPVDLLGHPIVAGVSRVGARASVA
jgi:hypothetical protein